LGLESRHERQWLWVLLTLQNKKKVLKFKVTCPLLSPKMLYNVFFRKKLILFCNKMLGGKLNFLGNLLFTTIFDIHQEAILEFLNFF